MPYKSLNTTIKTVMYKNQNLATDTPETPDDELSVGPDPVDTAETEKLEPHPRHETPPKAHRSLMSMVRHHILRNRRGQQKHKIIDNP